MGSPYIFNCPYDGERASVMNHEHGFMVVCPKCHLAEYGATIEQAKRCFLNPTETEKKEAE